MWKGEDLGNMPLSHQGSLAAIIGKGTYFSCNQQKEERRQRGKRGLREKTLFSKRKKKSRSLTYAKEGKRGKKVGL